MKLIVDNLAVEYKDEGQGPVLLLLHGWMQSSGNFSALAKILTQKYRVIRLDLPGFGESEIAHSAWDVGDYVQFTAHFLAKLNVAPAALVGHSLGGRIVLKGLAGKALVAPKAVLIASAGLADRQTLRNWSFKMIAKAGKAATTVPPFTLLRAKLRSKLYAAAKSDYGAAGAMTPTFLSIVAENLAPLAPLVSQPTLLIWGSKDDTTPIEEGMRLQALMPDAKLEIVEGAGHSIQEEKPDEVAKLISAFV